MNELMEALHEIDPERFYPAMMEFGTVDAQVGWFVHVGKEIKEFSDDDPEASDLACLEYAVQEAIKERDWEAWTLYYDRDPDDDRACYIAEINSTPHAETAVAVKDTPVEALGWAFVKAARI